MPGQLGHPGQGLGNRGWGWCRDRRATCRAGWARPVLGSPEWAVAYCEPSLARQLFKRRLQD